jgi:molecular chaperone GrpE
VRVKKMNSEDRKLKEEELKEEKGPEAEEAEETEIPEDEQKETEEKTEDEAKDEAEAEEKKSEEDEALNTKYLRLMADFQNYKRRTEKEKGDIYSYANEKLVSQLLEVVDNFERALRHESTADGYAEGMEMIFKQLTGVLEKAGLEEINALGEDFDPNFHNAVMTEDNDEYESGKVTEVMQKGYTLNSKVIRPSMVKVNN